eukprot:c9724_g1_i1.p1 GENE.c9724_g1_i1~~c9724_g1_i1.p1  ORF type:complete len:243 (-),score=44.38 c9724_g1_i1:735-1463(-)
MGQMNKHGKWISRTLIVNLVFALVALGCGAAARASVVDPQAGGWWTIVLGLPTIMIGYNVAKNTTNECLRITFIVVGVFGVMLYLGGAIMDLTLGSFMSASSECFAYNDAFHASKLDCCIRRQCGDSFTGNVTAAMCEASESPNSCVCCYFNTKDANDGRTFTWTLHGSCNHLKDDLSSLLFTTCVFNFLCAIVLTIALSISCCRCCLTEHLHGGYPVPAPHQVTPLPVATASPIAMSTPAN